MKDVKKFLWISRVMYIICYSLFFVFIGISIAGISNIANIMFFIFTIAFLITQVFIIVVLIADNETKTFQNSEILADKIFRGCTPFMIVVPIFIRDFIH